MKTQCCWLFKKNLDKTFLALYEESRYILLPRTLLLWVIFPIVPGILKISSQPLTHMKTCMNTNLHFLVQVDSWPWTLNFLALVHVFPLLLLVMHKVLPQARTKLEEWHLDAHSNHRFQISSCPNPSSQNSQPFYAPMRVR